MALFRGDVGNFAPALFDGPPYHLVFERGGGSDAIFYFPVPPSQIQITTTERVQTIQTLDGVFADDLGDGIIEMRLQGTFGYGRQRTTDADRTGLENFQRIMTLIRQRLIDIKGSDPNTHAIKFVDTQHRIILRCVMPEFQALMDSQRPLISSYSMSLTVIETQKLFEEADPPPQANRSSPNVAIGSHQEDLSAQAALLIPAESTTKLATADATAGTTYTQLAMDAYGLTKANAAYTVRMMALSSLPSTTQQNTVTKLSQASYSVRNSDPSLPFDGTLRDWRR
jgi:hypothetical protein